MTRDEWTKRFADRLVEASDTPASEAETHAADFAETRWDDDWLDPEAAADGLIALWDDEGEVA